MLQNASGVGCVLLNGCLNYEFSVEFHTDLRDMKYVCSLLLKVELFHTNLSGL